MTGDDKIQEINSKKRRRELVNEAAERLAEIVIMQIESKKNKKKKIDDQEKI